jgi:hypothetical protein
MLWQSPPAGADEASAPRESMEEFFASLYLLVGGLIPPLFGLFSLEADGGAAPVVAGAPAPLAVFEFP